MDSFFSDFDETGIDKDVANIMEGNIMNLVKNIDVEPSTSTEEVVSQPSQPEPLPISLDSQNPFSTEIPSVDNIDNSAIEPKENPNKIENKPQPKKKKKRRKKKKSDSDMERPKRYPEIVNVVASIHLGCSDLDLMRISQKAKNASFNPKRFKAVSIRLQNPPTTCHVFGNGRVVSIGGRSVKDAKVSTRRVGRMVKKIGPYPCKWKDFKVLSMMTRADVGFRVDLFSLSMEHSNFATYEPEIFSGCVYRMVEPKATLMIFHSGRFLIITKDENILESLFESIYPVLLDFKVKKIE